MKKKIFRLFVLHLFLMNVIFCVTNYQEDFLKANNFYKQGDLSQAYELYKSIPNPGPEVNYNLGNCAYKLGQYGYALLFWKRAELDWGIFNRGELLYNIALLKNQFTDSLKKPKSSFFEYFSSLRSYIVSVVKAIPLFIIQFLFLLIWFFLFLYVRFLFKRKRRFLIVFLFIWISLLGTLLVIKYSLYYRHNGVVISKKAILLSGPGKNFQELGGVPEATEVLIQKESDEFYKVKFNRQSGWISQKDVQKI